MADLKDFRADDYMNFALAIGTRQDRSEMTHIQGTYMMRREELTGIYMQDGISRRIIDLPAEESTREWFRIVGDVNSEQVASIEQTMRELGMQQAFTDALRWKRLYGGAAIIMGINDGGSLDMPLNEDKARSVDFLRVVDRWQMDKFQEDMYDDPQDARYGKVRLWTINPVTSGVPYKVHESRIIIFDGAALPDYVREMNSGWGSSVIQYCYNHIKRMGMAYRHANNLLERMQQAVHKIPKMSDYTKTDAGREAVKARLNMVDMARGITNTIAIDGEEEYTVNSLTLTGVDNLLDRYAESVSAVSGIPLTKLMGRSSGGLNSTGDGDLENWYATVRQMQEEDLRMPVERIVHIIANTDEKFEIEFNPLYTESERERAETGKISAETIDLYVGMGAMDASEARTYLRDKTEYQIDDGETASDPYDIPTDEGALNEEAKTLAVS